MEDEKKYFWMRLRTDFFDDGRIDYICEQDAEDSFILIYLKLCLKSLQTDGLLYRDLNGKAEPYSHERLAKALGIVTPRVTLALQHFEKAGLIVVMENGILSFPQVHELVGSEAANNNAARQRRFRERKNAEKNAKKAEELLQNVSISNATRNAERYDSNVTSVTKNNVTALQNRNESIEIEKEIEIDIYNTQQSEKPKRKSKPKPQKNPYGKNQNVMLSDQELETFKEEQPEHWQRFIDELSGWLKANKVTRRDYLKALRNWAERDYNGYRFKRHDPDTELEEIEQTIKTLIY